MDTNFLLYGVSLGGLVLGLVRLLGEVGLVDRPADLVRGLGLGAAFLLVANAEALAVQYAWFEAAVVQGGGFLSVFLLSMGYGPSVRNFAQRVSIKILGI